MLSEDKKTSYKKFGQVYKPIGLNYQMLIDLMRVERVKELMQASAGFLTSLDHNRDSGFRFILRKRPTSNEGCSA